MVMDVWKKIEQKQFSRVYLLYGTERFLINETKHKLINNALTEEEMDFNFASYDLEETPIETAVEDAETFPFMGEQRVIFLHNPVFLTAEKTKEKIEHNVKVLEAYLNEPAPYTILVFIAPYEKLDERKKITKLIKKSASIVEAKKLNEHELKTWIRTRASINQVQIDEDAIDMLLVLAGTNLMLLASEVDKLSLYAEDEKRIDREVVEKLTARSLEQNIFELVEKVVRKDIEGALRIYYDLLKQNEEPIKILSILAGQFRLLYQVKELSRKGYGQQQIASYLKVHPYRVKLAAGQAKLFEDNELSRIMDLLATSDLQMKSGGLRKEMIIEMFFFNLHTPKEITK
ncbi:DNA polymerase III subunit delta [Falsibacillus albus]|uniref:DNA polymerase III subunit delta n=1 Tax=Falsibacillus albus TaxID=2478915 RepID=A0A3L7K6V9_9BACI|nr:DNA polymerase III subunit delta [Falsibacillus albus]RLQ98325.1 DNA polymerase III subunit delta [Falsibacillus albus]